MLVLIFNVVNDLGRQLGQTGAYTLMQGGELATSAGLNNLIFIKNPLSTAQEAALFNDKIYGLGNPDHWTKWSSLDSNIDPQGQILLQKELLTLFGVSDAQFQELIVGW